MRWQCRECGRSHDEKPNQCESCGCVVFEKARQGTPEPVKEVATIGSTGGIDGNSGPDVAPDGSLKDETVEQPTARDESTRLQRARASFSAVHIFGVGFLRLLASGIGLGVFLYASYLWVVDNPNVPELLPVFDFLPAGIVNEPVLLATMGGAGLALAFVSLR